MSIRDTLLDIDEVERVKDRFLSEIISIAIKWAPKETKRVLKSVEDAEDKINELKKCLREQLPD